MRYPIPFGMLPTSRERNVTEFSLQFRMPALFLIIFVAVFFFRAWISIFLYATTTVYITCIYRYM